MKKYFNPIKKQFNSLVKNIMYDKISYQKSGNNASLFGTVALTLEEI